MGSSPRMRGTPAVAFCSHATSGLIPTYAGNTIWRAGRVQKLSGSSPRMRGTLSLFVVGVGQVGLIPTYAGNTDSEIARILLDRAHPHVCGEHKIGSLAVIRSRGSSPRMRGTPGWDASAGVRAGLIPTYAGNTGWATGGWTGPGAHPHVCGEHSKWHALRKPPPGSSPRMRGTHLLTWGFIPTHQVLELVWSPKPVLTLHDFRAYRRREARLYLLALLHPFRGPRSSFGADGRIISFTPSKSTGSHG